MPPEYTATGILQATSQDVFFWLVVATGTRKWPKVQIIPRPNNSWSGAVHQRRQPSGGLYSLQLVQVKEVDHRVLQQFARRGGHPRTELASAKVLATVDGLSVEETSLQPAESTAASQHTTPDNPTLDKLLELQNSSSAEARRLRPSSLLGLLIEPLQQIEQLPPKADPYNFAQLVGIIEQADLKFREGVALRALAKTANEEIVDCVALIVGGLIQVFAPCMDLRQLMENVCDRIVIHPDVRGKNRWTEVRRTDLYAAAIVSRQMLDEEVARILDEMIEL